MTAAAHLGILMLALTATANGSQAERGALHVRYSVTVQNTSQELVPNAQIEVYAPVFETAGQRLLSIAADAPYTLVGDSLGNQQLVFTITLAPLAQKVVRIKATLRYGLPEPPAPDPQSLFLRTERYVEVDHPVIQALASRIDAGTPAQTAQRIVATLRGRLPDSGFISEPRGAAYALQTGTGDCTEYMFLFIALARAKEIPARGVRGFAVTGDAVLQVAGLHDWAEYWAGGSWHVADVQKNDELGVRYVALRVLGAADDGSLARAGNERLAVRMN